VATLIFFALENYPMSSILCEAVSRLEGRVDASFIQYFGEGVMWGLGEGFYGVQPLVGRSSMWSHIWSSSSGREDVVSLELGNKYYYSQAHPKSSCVLNNFMVDNLSPKGAV
jgi:hypothetical protein